MVNYQQNMAAVAERDFAGGTASRDTPTQSSADMLGGVTFQRMVNSLAESFRRSCTARVHELGRPPARSVLAALPRITEPASTTETGIAGPGPRNTATVSVRSRLPRTRWSKRPRAARLRDGGGGQPTGPRMALYAVQGRDRAAHGRHPPAGRSGSRRTSWPQSSQSQQICLERVSSVNDLADQSNHVALNARPSRPEPRQASMARASPWWPTEIRIWPSNPRPPRPGCARCWQTIQQATNAAGDGHRRRGTKGVRLPVW